MRPKQWHLRAICPECGASSQAPFGRILPDACAACGCAHNEDWLIAQMRWMPTGRWWRPSTWNDAIWEVAGERLPEILKIHGGNVRLAPSHLTLAEKHASERAK